MTRERAPLRLAEADPQGAEALALLAEAAAEARALYPELHDPAAPPPTNGPTPPRGCYLLAWRDGRPVGMGAHRPLDAQTTEIRRLFVTRAARGAGVAQGLLAHLQAHAAAAGFTRLVLETGCRQLPAMRLYERCGFVRIAAFGAYADDPTSVCYGKTLAPPTRPGV